MELPGTANLHPLRGKDAVVVRRPVSSIVAAGGHHGRASRSAIPTTPGCREGRKLSRDGGTAIPSTRARVRAGRAGRVRGPRRPAHRRADVRDSVRGGGAGGRQTAIVTSSKGSTRSPWRHRPRAHGGEVATSAGQVVCVRSAGAVATTARVVARWTPRSSCRCRRESRPTATRRAQFLHEMGAEPARSRGCDHVRACRSRRRPSCSSPAARPDAARSRVRPALRAYVPRRYTMRPRLTTASTRSAPTQ